jgi:uncharacterized membrane protein
MEADMCAWPVQRRHQEGLAVAADGLPPCAHIRQAGPRTRRYSFWWLTVPGALTTVPCGINNRGQIVGHWGDVQGRQHGFLLAGQHLTCVDIPGAYDTWAAGMNDCGQIVGYYTEATGGTAGFLRDGTTWTRLAAPGAAHTYVLAINDHGQMVGGYCASLEDTTQEMACALAGMQWSHLAAPTAYYSTATGINNAGAMVISMDEDVLLLRDARWQRLDSLDANTIHVGGMNNHTQVVGAWEDPAVIQSVGFLLQGNLLTLIAVPGTRDTTINGLNDAGHLVGTCMDRAGRTQGFLARPTSGRSCAPSYAGQRRTVRSRSRGNNTYGHVAAMERL